MNLNSFRDWSSLMILGDAQKTKLESIRASVRMLGFFAVGLFVLSFILFALSSVFGWRGWWLSVCPVAFPLQCLVAVLLAFFRGQSHCRI